MHVSRVRDCILCLTLACWVALLWLEVVLGVPDRILETRSLLRQYIPLACHNIGRYFLRIDLVDPWL